MLTLMTQNIRMLTTNMLTFFMIFEKNNDLIMVENIP